MKKFFALMLVLTMALSLFAACGRKAESTGPADAGQETIAEQPADTAASDPTGKEELTNTGSADAGQDPLTILETIWSRYADEEKFAIMGGNAESGVFDAPGEYDLAYAENLTFNLLVPGERIPDVDKVASMIHAMNANTFTCGAFRLAEGVSAQDFAAAMQEAVQGNMWMCGFPERLVIASPEEGHIIMAFGVDGAMEPFFTHLREAYPEAEILFDEPIA